MAKNCLKPPTIRISSSTNNTTKMSVDQDPIVSTEPAPLPTTQTYLEPHPYYSNNRKVSINEGLHGHDNLAYESPRSRKVSSTSEHAEIGPTRKKSLMYNMHALESLSVSGHSDNGRQINGDTRYKKHSTTESLRSNKTQHSEAGDNIDNRSWWYLFCLKCRQKEAHPSWQPVMWPKVCPYPFCPTYRQFSRLIALVLIFILSWCILYSIIGETAAPGGRLFQLIVLCVCAQFGGWLIKLVTLPPLIGMLFTGLLLQNIGIVDIDEAFSHITSELRRVALVIILTRAGLDLDPNALKRLKFTVIKIGLVPWFVEAAVVTILSHFLMGIAWDYAVLSASIIAAVSPAVIVPCLFRLRVKGYGVAKGIPTLIIAISGIDDAASVAFFGVIQSIMFSNDSLTMQILQGPISVIGGIGFGLIWGIISSFVPERHDPFMVPLRILLLLVGGLIAVFGSDLVGFGGAGPLGCVAAAFVSIYCWCKQGWEIEENPAATAFEIFWMIFEPILFGITGAQIKFEQLNGSDVYIAVGILITAAVLRMLITVVTSIRCKLNLKEKIFVSIACMAKATVQAALGPVTLGLVNIDSIEHEYANKILIMCILSIMLTAPTGAILITLTGPRLLNKTRIPVVPEGWRRSHRPSIRDISIIDEEEERNTNIEASITRNVSQNDLSKNEPIVKQ